MSDLAAQPGLFADDDAAAQPLAARMRPRTLDEFVGQAKLLAPGQPLRRTVELGQSGSLVLWGPPGSGKTTLARLIAQQKQRGVPGGVVVRAISAVTEGVGDLKGIVAEARRRRVRSVLIVDEIHRWSKAQQAALLPHVEEGLITLLGVTSENPHFDIIAPLRSRLRIFRLEPLEPVDVHDIVRRAVRDPERGIGALNVDIADETLDELSGLVSGDARTALNVLEAAALSAPAGQDGRRHVTRAGIHEALQARPLRYDRQADDHYQTISAFIKSVRGSDPDASVFWLAKMVVAGEDVRFITRRLLILASEDIGNADPNALVVTQAAAEAVEVVGYPEAELILAQATLYLALAPKSNVVLRAIQSAKEAIAAGANTEVPLHLRNPSFGGAGALGYGTGYRYPHDAPGGWVEQQYLPDGVVGRFYVPPDKECTADVLQPRLDARAPVPRRSNTPEN